MFFDNGLELKRALYEEFGGFADKRIKNVESGSKFIADDRTERDKGANKQLFGWFCKIFIDVERSDEVQVTLSGGVPLSDAVRAWAQRHRAELMDEQAKSLRFVVKRGEQEMLSGLASAMSAIAAPGTRYGTPSYKHVCPRVAASLFRLKSTLDSAWRESA
jgi:hypothetical protein